MNTNTIETKSEFTKFQYYTKLFTIIYLEIDEKNDDKTHEITDEQYKYIHNKTYIINETTNKKLIEILHDVNKMSNELYDDFYDIINKFSKSFTETNDMPNSEHIKTMGFIKSFNSVHEKIVKYRNGDERLETEIYKMSVNYSKIFRKYNYYTF
jgi:hypothetical protein